MSSVISTITAYDKYYWDTNTLQKILYDTNKSTKSINAIRSCIEADEATLLNSVVYIWGCLNINLEGICAHSRY